MVGFRRRPHRQTMEFTVRELTCILAAASTLDPEKFAHPEVQAALQKLKVARDTGLNPSFYL